MSFGDDKFASVKAILDNTARDDEQNLAAWRSYLEAMRRGIKDVKTLATRIDDPLAKMIVNLCKELLEGETP